MVIFVGLAKFISLRFRTFSRTVAFAFVSIFRRREEDTSGEGRRKRDELQGGGGGEQ